MTDFCDKCGRNIALVGRRHRCLERVAETVVVHIEPVVVHRPKLGGSRGADRHKNTEKRRAYRRQWMKRSRLKQKVRVSNGT